MDETFSVKDEQEEQEVKPKKKKKKKKMSMNEQSVPQCLVSTPNMRALLPLSISPVSIYVRSNHVASCEGLSNLHRSTVRVPSLLM
jgi:hypothetical protein